MLRSHNARQLTSCCFYLTETFLTSPWFCHTHSHHLLQTIWLWQIRQWRHKQEVRHISATLSPLMIKVPQWVDNNILYLWAVDSCFSLPPHTVATCRYCMFLLLMYIMRYLFARTVSQQFMYRIRSDLGRLVYCFRWKYLLMEENAADIRCYDKVHWTCACEAILSVQLKKNY